MKLLHSTSAAAEAAWDLASPVLETLEGRLLLSGAAPTFATALPDKYVITPGSGITIGVDGADADGDALKITAALTATNANLVITTSPVTNRYAVLHFTGVRFVNQDGSVTIGEGDIVAQIFEKQAPTAAGRFITLATKHVAANGALSAPTATSPAFYDDVVVHRVIDEFMIQTGDATNGDGTGSSPLADFGKSDGSDMNPKLTFDSPGVLAFANSSSPSTSNGQFFITSSDASFLDHSTSQAGYYIFGQLISGWDVLNAITQVATSGGSNGSVYEPPKLADVHIVTSKQDAVFTISAGTAFTGTADVKVTLDDSHGNPVDKTIHLTKSTDASVTETATVALPSATTVTCLPGHTTTFQPTITNATSAWVRVYDVEAANAQGRGSRATVTMDPTTYLLTITVPQNYPFAHFIVRILAQNQGAGQFNVTPPNEELDVWVAGASPTITIPSTSVTVLPGAQGSFTATVSDDQGAPTVASVETSNPALQSIVSIDPTTKLVSINVPTGITTSSVSVTISAQEAGFTHPRPGTTTFTIATAGAASVIADVPAFTNATPGEKFDGITASFTDNTPGRPLAYTITSSRSDIHPALVATDDPNKKKITFTSPKTATGMFTVTVTAAETGYTDRAPTSKTFYVYNQYPGDPEIGGRVVTSTNGQAMGTFQLDTAGGKMLYVADSGNGLEIYDITDPTSPFIEGSYATDGEAWNVVVTPNRMVNGVARTVAFVATINSTGATTGVYGVVVLDVTDPTTPTVLTTLASRTASASAPQPATVSVYVSGDTLYQLDWMGGMKIWNIADCGNATGGATKITALATFDHFTYPDSAGGQHTYPDQSGTDTTKWGYMYAAAVAVQGHYAFMADVTGYFFVLDISGLSATPPTAPTFVTALGTGGRPYDLKLQGNTLYVIDQYTGLIAVDVTTPTAPLWLGYSPLDNMAWSKLTVSGNLIAVSGTTGYTLVDATQFPKQPPPPKTPPPMVKLAPMFVFNAPSWGGQASVLNGRLALPFGTDGVVIMDATDLTDASFVADRRDFTLPNGHTVTVSVTGPGDARVHFDAADGNKIARLEAVGTTSASSVTVTVRGGYVPIAAIEIDGSLASLNAATADLTGNLTATGLVGSVTLHSVLGTHQIQFNTALGTVTARDKLTLNLGRVGDSSLNMVGATTINTHGEPIAALAVSEWVDSDGNDTITAPWIGRLTSTRVAGVPTGNFGASMALSGAGLAATGLTLGSAGITGNVTGGLWNIEGNVGAVSIASSGADWVFDAGGSVVSLDATGTAGLAGTLTADYFGRIASKGDLTAAIGAGASDPKKQTSIGTLSAAVVRDVGLDLPGGIGSISVAEWDDTGGAAESIHATWIGSVTTTGRKANAALGLDERAGDFDPALTLTGVGTPTNQPTLGTTRIAGDLAGPDAPGSLTWDITGDVGAITVGGEINNWAAVTRNGGDVKSLTAARIRNAAVTADALGAVKAWSWEAGSLTANTVASLTVTGYAGNATLAQPAVAGNFGAQVTVHGLDVQSPKSAMGATTIAGDMVNSTWVIEHGTMAAMTVNGTVRDSNVRAAGSMLGLTMGAVDGSKFLAGVTVAKAPAEVVVADVNSSATISSLTIRGWRVTGTPPTFFSGSTFLAASFGTVALTNADPAAPNSLYVLSASAVKSVKYTDTAAAANNWSWKPTDPAEPPAWTALKHLIPAQ
jgi:cyclophilin family peptidyl-prolyl cis-trans isomerase